MLSIDLRGHTALITGASGMLGRVIARTFADCGANLILHYCHNKEEAVALGNELRSKTGRRILTVQADITDADSVRAMRDTVAASSVGMPDILVHNAVIQYEWKPVLEQPLGDFDSQYGSCVMQTVHMTQAFVPHIIQKGEGGRIVVINTECAALAEANCGAYTAAKRGLDGLVRVLAKELGPDNITVNQVAPGWTVTENDRRNRTEVQPDYDRTVPLGRRGTDAEIAQMCAFLASPLASFTTGAYIPVSGGRVMPAI
ncbi:MAG: SDR family oxidoreductase [Oscillospiraceae bacterium]|nr:SDR family oxidoreductase [Oscillospiraceae bacterium]